MSDEAQEYVAEQVFKAEHELEDAIIACEDAQERGELLGAYRELVGVQFRYHD